MVIDLWHLRETIGKLLIDFGNLLGYLVASNNDHGWAERPKVHEHDRWSPKRLIDSLECKIYSPYD
jgi:hypothetical protein